MSSCHAVPVPSPFGSTPLQLPLLFLIALYLVDARVCLPASLPAVSMWICLGVCVPLIATVCVLCCYGRLFVKFVGRLKKRQAKAATKTAAKAKATAAHLAPSFIACDGLLCMLTWLLCNFSILTASVYTHAEKTDSTHTTELTRIC